MQDRMSDCSSRVRDSFLTVSYYVVNITTIIIMIDWFTCVSS